MRQEISNNTAFGQTIAPIVRSGGLVGDDLIADLVLQHLPLCDQRQQGFILDGFPRTLIQAKTLSSAYKEDVIAVNIVLDRQVTIAKLLGRRLCKTCGGSFNTAHIVEGDYDMPAILPNPKTCRMGANNCKVDLIQRDDDRQEIIEQRLQTFENNIEPILQYYQAKNRLLHFQVKKGVKDIDRLWLAMSSFPLK